MPATYTLISSNVLTSSALTVTFSSIPSTYTDLVLRCSIRTDVVGANDTLRVNFNNDSTGIYSTTLVRGDGATGSSSNTSLQGYVNARQIDGSTATSNTFASTEIYIPSYTASQNKPTSVVFAQEDNLTTAYQGAIAALYRSTTAISRIDLFTSGANFVSGSSFYLYGISNA
jgi:hypothetical protein